MDNQDIAASFREKNNQLVPVLLARLHRYRKEKTGENGAEGSLDLSRPFAEFSKDTLVNGTPHRTPSKSEVRFIAFINDVIGPFAFRLPRSWFFQSVAGD